MYKHTLYTAVGRYNGHTNEQGYTLPMVLLGNKEYGLDPQEYLLWSSLHWRIAFPEELPVLYHSHLSSKAIPIQRSLDDCLERLLTRGLVIRGTGETDYDALYDLISPLYVVSLEFSPFLRFLGACKMRLQGITRQSPWKQLVRWDRRTRLEQTVMRLSSRVVLSTAELIRCVEMDIRTLSDTDSLVAALYQDRDTTSDNIGFLVKTAPCARDVTMAVANLYVRRQMIFDRV